MTPSKHSQRKAGRKTGKTTPPLLIGLVGLVIAVGFACFMGLAAIQNEKVTREAVSSLQTMWDERVSSRTSIDQDKTEIEVQQDRLKLATVTDGYRQLHQLISASAIGLVVLSLLCFIGFQFGILRPLRKLERSSRDLVDNDLNGHVWGLDRDDAFGSLARSIADIRKATISISDMVVQTENGEQHVRFEGRSGAVFGALISDLQKTVEQLTQHSTTLETVSKEGQESIKSLGDVTTEQTQNVESALSSISDKLMTTNEQWNEQFATIHDEWKGQLANTHKDWSERLSTLFHQNNQIQGQSKQMVDQFTRDMHSLNQIAGATGARVAQTLQILGTTDRDIKKAAQQSLESSTTFSKQANELMEKLQAATNLLRASGKVMSETTDATRTRLNEAINSVSSHDQAIRAFLGDTEEKTDRITSLLEDVSRSAIHASETVSTFDSRMALFEEKSNTAFNRIDASGDAIGTASSQLTDVHSMMQGSLESMSGHTEMLARILTSIRDEYASFSDEWKNNLAETAPVFAQLKEVSDGLQTQLHDEWAVYAQQSRQLLTALEQDVRAMNGRTEMVTQDTEKLITHLSEQTQRVSDNANHFDLQIANISMRLDDATTHVLNSNKQVVENTASEIKTIHTSVQDMAQRLSILSQLTGTLGAVAGQLGQIVPSLGATVSDNHQLQRMPVVNHGVNHGATADPAILARFEEISSGFTNTVDNIKGEFDSVRDQIGRWVQMLTGGYKNLAEQINAVDGSIDEKITSLKQQIESATAAQITAAAAIASQPAPPAPINLGEELVPAMRLIHEGLEKGYAIDTLLSNDLQKLKTDLQAIAKDVYNTTSSLQNLGSLVETGFELIDAKDSKPVAVTVDASRVESVAQALDQLLRKLQGQSDSVVGKLGAITQRLEGTSTKLQQVRYEVPAVGHVPASPIATPSLSVIEFSEKANLDQLQQQIEHISTMLDQFSADGTGFINPMGEQEELTPDKSKAFIDTVMATIIRLHHIAESIEKIGGNTSPTGGQDSKTG